MEVMRYEDIGKLIGKLDKRENLSNGDILMYFVSPFLKSLGYDIFNLDEVDMKHDKGVTYVTVSETENLVVTLNKDGFEDANGSHIYLRVNLSEKKMILYFNTMSKWEVVEEVDFTQESSDKYESITNKIAKQRMETDYKDKGERYLTGIVLRNQLDEGEWETDFVVYSLVKEFENPSDLFVEIIANRLSEFFTTETPEDLVSNLGGIKEKGLEEMVSRALKKDYGKSNVESNVTGYTGNVTTEKDEEAEKQRIEEERQAKAEKERLEKAKAEQERIEREEAERIAREEAIQKEKEEQAEKERLEKEKAEQEKREREAEEARIEAARKKQEQEEAERLEKARIEEERQKEEEAARIEAEQKRLEQERLEREQKEQEDVVEITVEEDGEQEEGSYGVTVDVTPETDIGVPKIDDMPDITNIFDFDDEEEDDGGDILTKLGNIQDRISDSQKK